jgi:beta-lactamase class D
MSKCRLAAYGGLFYLLATPVLAAPVCTLVVEADSGKVWQRVGTQCDARNSPASTFKIAIAVMGYDADILSDAHAPAWPYKEEYAAWRESWKTTIDPTSWLRESVVWYSREITRRLGAERFKDYADRFDYGNRDLSGDPGQSNGLSNAWLSSSLQISPVEQVAFIRKLLSHQLPASERALDQTIAILPQFTLADGWTAHGKTGTGFQVGPDSKPDRDRQFGWFVGWAQKAEYKVVFARLIKDDDKIQEAAGFRTRDSLLADLPRLLQSR